MEDATQLKNWFDIEDETEFYKKNKMLVSQLVDVIENYSELRRIGELLLLQRDGQSEHDLNREQSR